MRATEPSAGRAPLVVYALVVIAATALALWLTRPRHPIEAEPEPTAHVQSLEDFVDELAPAQDLPVEDVGLEQPEAMRPVIEALERAGQGDGVARIVAYGGSHTAGDLFTGKMRELLQGRYGDSGHGFVPMAPVVHEHWAWGVRIDAAEGFEPMQVGFKRREVFRYGLAGIAFRADEEGAFAAVQADSWGNGRFASRLELLYDRLPEAGSFDVLVDSVVVDTVASAADPPEAGVGRWDVSDGPHRLEVRTHGDGPVTLFGVVMERDRPGVIVDNLGLVGSKARHHLLWDRELWRELFVPRDPDLVLLAYGNNETTDTHLTIEQHEAQLREMMDRLAEAAPDAACLLVGPTARPRLTEAGELEPRQIVADITDMQRAVAADRGCAFFDTLAWQGGLGAGRVWLERDPPLMRSDRQHLTRDGYHAWGTHLTRAILQAGSE